ncbi:Bug family tripartite tricarboxylate transporter substrate binding protein [Falsiroseomonas selenitidurans]|uniref:Tripartite tricarboxylate transporter substrate binding protein n=1 Tax=Falsiroseomonas selenitidurans TaxID=2716335 RepID=A0ABX1E169_9PROT|nr:tripartite tricarboxylate transporter substrate-binding protein [Falsiroseomonas selenitidurans]NKC30894.1 tripartite tricarboxylate transporter substrate binding protein [Falsiroseomonas selenitidurans]
MRRRSLLAAGLAAAPAHAQAGYPDRPVTLVVGYGAGGATDIIARSFAERMQARLSQPMVVQNLPGAGGTIASDRVAKAAPDGHTIMLIANAHAVAPGLYPRLPYDTAADFAPVYFAGHSANALVVPAGSPDGDLAALVARARAAPAPLQTGSAALAGWQPAHQIMKEAYGLAFEHVPYRSGPQGQADLIAGRLDFMVSNVLEVAAHVRGGRLRALAVSSPTRSPLLPEVPTFAELGVAALQSDSWFGFLAPRGAPDAALERLHAAFAEVAMVPEVQARLRGLGLIQAPMSRTEWGRLYLAEVERWSAVPRRANIRVE